MSDSFKQIYNIYISKVQTDFEKFMRSRYSLLSDAVVYFFENIENTSEFKLLLTECNKISKHKLSNWELKNYLRRSGTYNSIIDNKLDIENSYMLLKENLKKSEFPIIFILPLPRIDFPGKEYDLDGWSLRHFGKDFIDSLSNSQINKVFYPHATCNSTLATQLKYIRVKSTQEVKVNKLLLDLSGSIDWQANNLPPELIIPFRVILLFRWEDTHIRNWLTIPFKYHLEKDGHWWLPFHEPKPRTLDYNPFSGSSEIFTLQDSWFKDNYGPDGEYIGQRSDPPYYLSEKEESYFIDYCKKMTKMIKQLKKSEKQFKSIDRALDYFTRASCTYGLLQLLWNISTLEILLAPSNQEQISETVARRTAIILGRDYCEKTIIRSLVKKLYGQRSKLVHGGDFKKTKPNQRYLTFGRSLARRILTWFISYYSSQYQQHSSNIKSVDELHALIDFDRDSLPKSPL